MVIRTCVVGALAWCDQLAPNRRSIWLSGRFLFVLYVCLTVGVWYATMTFGNRALNHSYARPSFTAPLFTVPCAKREARARLSCTFAAIETWSPQGACAHPRG